MLAAPARSVRTITGKREGFEQAELIDIRRVDTVAAAQSEFAGDLPGDAESRGEVPRRLVIDQCGVYLWNSANGFDVAELFTKPALEVPLPGGPVQTVSNCHAPELVHRIAQVLPANTGIDLWLGVDLPIILQEEAQVGDAVGARGHSLATLPLLMLLKPVPLPPLRHRIADSRPGNRRNSGS